MKILYLLALFLGGIIGKLMAVGLEEYKRPTPHEDSMMTWITEEADDDEY